MFEEIIQINGKEAGPTSVILGGVHGDEVCGVEALKKILPTIEIERGRVFFGYGNPHAIEANKRFTEANLNRVFKSDQFLSAEEKRSYEYSRAQFLKQYLDQADALLDVHASYIVGSNPFIICEANAKEIVKYLPADLVVTGFDTVEPGGTDYYMNSTGKIGICVECGYLGDPKAADVAEKSIYAFLKARGHMKNDLSVTQQSYLHMYDLYLTKTKKFTLSKHFDDFEVVSKGQTIGMDGAEEILSKKESVILFARNLTQEGDEAFLLGEKRNSLA